ncbi:hypothetical protein PRK78_006159 [Emydomyces testavorans]|uniref:F-box domain-containing protein n=1 Tax=Emydomyces testavorans TaxID=2070801 RepID=A0AAF0ILD3_9EURO|nr:hypothetical protein PRK78_006159 [Emydomyces testavorans]
MDKLPVELVLRITDYLAPKDLVSLQLVCKGLLCVARDNLLWRSFTCGTTRCNNTNISVINVELKRHSDSNIRNKECDRLATDATSCKDSQDPYGEENINWYSEYIARNAPASVRWLQQPESQINHNGYSSGQVCEVKDDGSVCVWDYSQYPPCENTAARGKILERSKPGLLFLDKARRTGSVVQKGINEFLDAGDCVSINSVHQKAYIAVGNCLNEVDLAMLKVTSKREYSYGISTLSQHQLDYHVPITVATTMSLHIYDSRCPAQSGAQDDSLNARVSTPRQFNSGSPAASLPQPMPVSVLHSPLPNINSIFVAGRFPSILFYDRRFFPRLQSAVHSGARLSDLAVVSSVASLNPQAGKDWGNCHNLIACGEYNGKGSLEMYAFSTTSSTSDIGAARPTIIDKDKVYQNRQSVSRSKILSVASHGTKIVYSDANGNIRWVERDGRTPIRVWNINHNSQFRYQRSEVVRRLNGAEDGGRADFVRKLLPTGGALLDDEVLIWTGERLGSVGFYAYPQHTDENDELDEQKRREREYMEALDRSMRLHSHELDWLPGSIP